MAEIEKNPKKMTNMSERLDERDLHNILNELPMKDAVRAGILSRKWRNQWKYLANVVFKQSTGKEIESLTHFISLHRGNKIKKFHVEFKYRPNKEDEVNEWMSFAIKKEVEDLKLDFDMKGDNDPLYILPPFIFNCESLVSLSLKGCVLELPDSIYLPNLHTLSLTRMEIGSRNGRTIRKITSRAPLLERMSLVNCSRFRNFNIDASESPNLKELAIIETKVDLARSTGMDICAPSVEKLVFLYASPRREYHVKDVSNCLEFTFDEPQDQPQATSWQNTILPLRYHLVLLQILPSFAHVRVIRMGNLCVQGLYKALVRMRMVSLSCTRLEINASFQKWELPGIVVQLRACPVVEDLRFVMTPKHKKIQQFLGEPFDFEPIQIWKNEVNSLVATHLRNLKVVRIKLPGGRNRSRNLEDVFAQDEFGSELIRGLWNHGKHVRVLFSNVEVKSE